MQKSPFHFQGDCPSSKKEKSAWFRQKLPDNARDGRWQEEGYDSFGAWRRAKEKARRASAKSALQPASSGALTARQPALPQQQELQPPASPRHEPARQFDGLREHVQVTPGGSRVHSFERSTPRGSRITSEYKSPPGGHTLTARHEWYRKHSFRDHQGWHHPLAFVNAQFCFKARAKRKASPQHGQRESKRVGQLLV